MKALYTLSGEFTDNVIVNGSQLNMQASAFPAALCGEFQLSEVPLSLLEGKLRK
jgi:hypothetical protein